MELKYKIIFGIISVKNLNFGIELNLNHFAEIFEQLTYLGFFFHEKYPRETSVVIYEWNKPSSLGYIFNFRWSPNITVN